MTKLRPPILRPSRAHPVTCPHCGEVFTYSCQHANELARLSKAEHDDELERQERVLDRAHFRHWLMADHPNRALRIIEHHARSQGRRFRRTV